MTDTPATPQAQLPQRRDRRAGQAQRGRHRRAVGGPGLHGRGAVPGGAEQGPGALQGPDQLPDAGPARQPVRAQLDDLLHQRPDLRLPRVHAAPRRLVVQRGVAAATGSSSRSSTSPARPASWSSRAAPASTTSSTAPPEQHELTGGAMEDVLPPGVRGLPGDARRGRRPRGRPRRPARSASTPRCTPPATRAR